MFFWPVRLALKLCSLLLLLAIAFLIYCAVQVVRSSSTTSNPSAIAPASAIVVLPASSSRTTPGPDLTARLQEAAALYRAGRAPTLVIAGAQASTSSASGATIARRWLLRDGLPASAIVTVHADNAESGLARAKAVLAMRSNVIVVTDAIDALWTKDAGSAVGLKVVVAPPPSSKKPLFSELDPFWRQATGVAAGRLIGYSRTSWATH